MSSKRQSNYRSATPKPITHTPEQFVLYYFVFALPLIINPFGYHVFAGVKLYLIYATCFVLLYLTLNRILSEGFVLPDSGLLRLLLLFLLPAIISTLFSIHPKTSLFGEFGRFEGLFSWLAYIWLFIMGYTWLSESAQRNRIVSVLAVSSFIVASYGILQYFGFDFTNWQVPWKEEPIKSQRVHSSLGNPSTLGAYIVLILPVIALHAFNAKKKNATIFFWISFLVLMIALALTLSRGAWLGIAVSTLAMFMLYLWLARNEKPKSKNSASLKESRKVSFLLLVGGIVLALVISVFLLAPHAKERVLSAFDFNKGTVGGRILLWEQSLNLIADRPAFGWGPDTFHLAFPRYVQTNWEQKYLYDMYEEKRSKVIKSILITDNSHNYFIQIAATAGIIALIPMLTFFIAWFWQCCLWLKSTATDNKDRHLIIGIFGGVIAYLIAMQFHFSTIHVSPLMWLLLGSVVNLSPERYAYKAVKWLPREKKNREPGLRIIRISLACSLVIVLALMLSPVVADFHFKNAVAAIKTKNYVVAIQDFNRAQLLHPWEEEYSLTQLRALTLALDDTQERFILSAAEEALHKAEALNSTDPSLYFYKGDFYFAKGRQTNDQESFAEAEKIFTTLLELDPRFTQGYMRLGAIRFALGNFQGAISAWQEASSLMPDSANPVYNIAFTFEKMGNFEEARRYYRETLIIDPDDTRAKEALAKLEQDI